ncbi:hypothetical protein FDECE_6901 [Fusarium decemcellulare]|nr:hypothetical protein FDECE_6901 [Fusarium decemcellulare]
MQPEYFLFDTDASTEWQILSRLQPAFDTELPWRYSNSAEAEHEIRLETFKTKLSSDINNLNCFYPRRIFLSKAEFKSCQNQLQDLLVHLEDIIVSAATMARNFLSTPRSNLGNEASTASPQYPRLIRLGDLVQRANHGAKQITVDGKPEVFSSIDSSVQTLLEFFKTINNSRGFSRTPTISGPTRDEIDLGNKAYALLDLLTKKTSACGSHQAKIRLDASTASCSQKTLSMEVFLSSCDTSGKDGAKLGWELRRFTFIESKIEGCNAMLDLCKSSSSTKSSELWFTKKDIFDPKSPQPATAAQPTVMDSTPAISLAELLQLHLLSKGGPFSSETKAVLALSLARWFSCLLQTPHMRKDWTAREIYFSYGQDRIVTPTCPYIMCELDSSDNSNQSQTIDYQKFLLSFATLLLQIETGKMVTFTEPQVTKEEIWEIVRPLEREREDLARYLQAILACADFAKVASISKEGSLLTSKELTQRASSGKVILSIDDVRRAISVWVIENLKDYSRPFFENANEFVCDSIELPPDSTNVMAHLSERARSNCSFNSMSSGKNEYISRSIIPISLGCSDWYHRNSSATAEFRKHFKQFRRRFIEPKMTREIRKDSRRIKIVLLDTGIRVQGTDLGNHCLAATGYRRNNGFTKDLNPIKKGESECWFEGRQEIDDECGHGTDLAGLLLEFAPDADLYIGKISPTKDFVLHDGIAKAIEWAAKTIRADIITMSFGLDGYSMAMNDAIRHALEKTTEDGHQALIFAAASNNGLNKQRSFPARDERVICVHAVDGLGSESPTNFNPPLDKGARNFGTLGVGIDVKWNDKTVYKGGTSYATPILASIVANYLDWLGHMHRNKHLRTDYYKLLRQRGLIEKFLAEKMSIRKEESSSMLFVAPWMWFRDMGHDVLPEDPITDEVREQDEKTDKACVLELIKWVGSVDK